MKLNRLWSGDSAVLDEIAKFGEARLVRTAGGKLELRGGSASDRAAAMEWISLFFHEAVPRVVAA